MIAASHQGERVVVGAEPDVQAVFSMRSLAPRPLAHLPPRRQPGCSRVDLMAIGELAGGELERRRQHRRAAAKDDDALLVRRGHRVSSLSPST